MKPNQIAAEVVNGDVRITTHQNSATSSIHIPADAAPRLAALLASGKSDVIIAPDWLTPEERAAARAAKAA